jgi:hypothetical protein
MMNVCMFFILLCVQHCDGLRYNVEVVVLKQHDVLSIQSKAAAASLISDLQYVQSSCNYIYVCV